MKTKLFISMVIVLLFTLASCQKDQDTNAVSSASELASDNAVDTNGMELKITSSTILNATSASQIPSQMFAVNPMYKTSYSHIRQLAGQCSWTSYVICVKDIAMANCWIYNTSVSTVRSYCLNLCGGDVDCAQTITKLQAYATNKDYGKVGNYLRYFPKNNSTSRFKMIKEMLAHINSYHTPFIIVSSRGTYGHYRIIFSIDWTQNENTSTVYYTDCADGQTGTGITSNLQSMKLNLMLNSMILYASNYNALFFTPKSPY